MQVTSWLIGLRVLSCGVEEALVMAREQAVVEQHHRSRHVCLGNHVAVVQHVLVASLVHFNAQLNYFALLFFFSSVSR